MQANVKVVVPSFPIVWNVHQLRTVRSANKPISLELINTATSAEHPSITVKSVKTKILAQVVTTDTSWSMQNANPMVEVETVAIAQPF